MNNLREIIGENIRFERKKRKISIEDLSEFLGVSPSYVGLIERGFRGTTVKSLKKIADAFGISLDELVSSPKKKKI